MYGGSLLDITNRFVIAYEGKRKFISPTIIEIWLNLPSIA